MSDARVYNSSGYSTQIMGPVLPEILREPNWPRPRAFPIIPVGGYAAGGKDVDELGDPPSAFMVTGRERVIPATDLRERVAYIRTLAGVCGDHPSCHSHPCIHSSLDALVIKLDEHTAKAPSAPCATCNPAFTHGAWLRRNGGKCEACGMEYDVAKAPSGGNDA